MTDARVQTGWAYRNPKTETLENASLKILAVPDIGSRIFEFISTEKSICSELPNKETVEADCVFTAFTGRQGVSFLDCVGNVS